MAIGKKAKDAFCRLTYSATFGIKAICYRVPLGVAKKTTKLEILRCSQKVTNFRKFRRSAGVFHGPSARGHDNSHDDMNMSAMIT